LSPEIPPPLQKVLDRLDGVKKTGDAQYQARCPAHVDNNPSLSIAWAKNKVLLHDQAGCTTSEILEALNMKWGDLTQPSRVVATYVYEDEESQPLYRVRRTDPKGFFQEHPDPDVPDEWISGRGDAEAVPFHLGQLAEALDGGDDVYIVEGEADVEALWTAEYAIATTNHGGAGKWSASHSRYFAGTTSQVFIIADRDKPGYKHAVSVYDSLLEVGVTAGLLLPAVGKDAADHVRDHAISEFIPTNVAELTDLKNADLIDLDSAHAEAVAQQVEWLKVNQEARLALSAEGWAPPPVVGSLAEQLAAPEVPLAMLIDELAFVGANVLVNAVAKSGKTTLVLNVIRSLLSADPLFGRFDVSAVADDMTVAWWNAELVEAQALRWLREMDIPNADRCFPLHLRGYAVPFDAPAVEDWAVAWLRDRSVKVWVLDPKSALYLGEENSATETGAWLAAIDRIKRRAGVETLFLVHHASEAGSSDDPDDRSARFVRGRGSSRLEGWADVIWSWTGRFEEPRYLAAVGRDVDLPPFGGIRLSPQNRALRWDGNSATPAEDRRHSRLLEAYDALVEAGTPLKSGELQGHMSGVKAVPKRQAIQYGVDHGFINRTTGPSNSQLHAVGEKNPRLFRLTPETGVDQ
jgi:AAA domain